MAVALGPSSAFPQTGGNRTVSDLASQIARYVGGESDGDILSFAHACIHESIQRYNRVAWKFNRKQQSITLTTAETYTLEDDFRSPLRAQLLDSNGDRVGQVLAFIPYASWNEFTRNTNFDTAIPSAYTIRTSHTDGLVTVWPPPGDTLTYPTLLIDYNRWIPVPAVDSNAIDVPRDVSQAILDDAKARLFEAKRSGSEVDRAVRRAEDAYLWVASQHRDFGEIPVFGAGS